MIVVLMINKTALPIIVLIILKTKFNNYLRKANKQLMKVLFLKIIKSLNKMVFMAMKM